MVALLKLYVKRKPCFSFIFKWVKPEKLKKQFIDSEILPQEYKHSQNGMIDVIELVKSTLQQKNMLQVSTEIDTAQ